MRKQIIIGIVLLGVLGFVIKQLFFQPEFRFAGSLEATKVDLSSRLATTVSRVLVREGDTVKEGQLLVILNGEDVKTGSKLANDLYDRNLKLLKSGVIAQDSFDQVKNRKEDMDLRIDWLAVKAPISGKILNRYHEPSEWVSPGTKLITLANIKDIWAMVYVPQTEVGKLKVGMTVHGIIPELQDRQYTGKIVKINDEAEFTPKNVQTRAERTRLVFGVKVSFLGQNEDETLKPGMTIEIKLP